MSHYFSCPAAHDENCRCTCRRHRVESQITDDQLAAGQAGRTSLNELDPYSPYRTVRTPPRSK